MHILYSLILGVLASMIAHYVCKWLDGEEGSKASGIVQPVKMVEAPGSRTSQGLRFSVKALHILYSLPSGMIIICYVPGKCQL